MRPQPSKLPEVRSATHGLVATAGAGAFLLSAFYIKLANPFAGNLVVSALFILAVTATAIFSIDTLWQKIYRRPSTGLDFARNAPSWKRTLSKFCGLLGSFAFIGLLYWLFPEYHGSFYDKYYQLLRLILPPWIVLAIPYIRWVDRRMVEPHDGYWHMGQFVTLHWDRVDRRILGQHLLSWLIKGFFLPLMFTYMCNDLNGFMHTELGAQKGFAQWFEVIYSFFYFIDVALVSMGYLVSLRIFDNHIRSAEPTMLGWVVALVCYEPFWSMIVARQYIAYDPGYSWDRWLHATPFAYVLWGSAILLLTAVYVWATVMFGGRFSNLTHRGIITNGPYRWTKHPAYVAKNLSWWMISVPFVVHGSYADALRFCLLLLVMNFIYLMRAKTEEWHLSRDPEYVRYALWMEEHGLFRFLRRASLTRWLTYRQPSPGAQTPAK